MRIIRLTVLSAVMAAVMPLSVLAQDRIRIGAVSILDGTFAGPGADALRGRHRCIHRAKCAAQQRYSRTVLVE